MDQALKGKKLSLPLLREALPPESAPSGRAPVGVRPFNCKTDSDSSLQAKTRTV